MDVKTVSFVFRQLSQASASASTSASRKSALFQSLPAQFDRKTYIDIAARLQIPESTTEKQIAKFLKSGLLIKPAYGSYRMR